jgi:hypothetical protein
MAHVCKNPPVVGLIGSFLALEICHRESFSFGFWIEAYPHRWCVVVARAVSIYVEPKNMDANTLFPNPLERMEVVRLEEPSLVSPLPHRLVSLALRPLRWQCQGRRQKFCPWR